MELEVDELLEKEVLVPEPRHGKWKPDIMRLMHSACFEDEGANGNIEAKKKDALETWEGTVLRRAKLRIMVHVEYLDQPPHNNRGE